MSDREVVERVRRIETRVTKIGRALGIDVGGGKPVWGDGRVTVPSLNCGIGECMNVVPPEHRDQEIDVWVGNSYLLTFFVEP